MVYRPHLRTLLRLVLEDGGFLYSSDSYSDDLPYWVNGPEGPHLIIPTRSTPTTCGFINAQGFPDAKSFFIYLRDTFDYLYAEGAEAPKMMSVGLHCRLAGPSWPRGRGWPGFWITSASSTGCGLPRDSILRDIGIVNIWPLHQAHP